MVMSSQPENSAVDENPGGSVLDESEIAAMADAIGREAIPVLLEKFLSELDRRLPVVAEALERKEDAAGVAGPLQLVCHALAGSTSTVGALRLAEQCRAVEQSCKRGDAASAMQLAASILSIAEETRRQAVSVAGRYAA